MEDLRARDGKRRINPQMTQMTQREEDNPSIFSSSAVICVICG
jgi:hypothetical protein